MNALKRKGYSISMATTKAGQKAVNKYVKNNYDRINFTVQKGKKDIIQNVAEKQGESVNGYIKKAVSDRVKSDTGDDVEL